MVFPYLLTSALVIFSVIINLVFLNWQYIPFAIYTCYALICVLSLCQHIREEKLRKSFPDYEPTPTREQKSDLFDENLMQVYFKIKKLISRHCFSILKKFSVKFSRVDILIHITLMVITKIIKLKQIIMEALWRILNFTQFSLLSSRLV